MAIVKARSDGKVHFADCEVGDLFKQDGVWWAVEWLGSWDESIGPDDERRRVGGSRPATVLDAANELASIAERLSRLERDAG